MTTPTLHRLDLAEPGTLRGATVVCLAPETAICRQWCTECSPDAEGCTHEPILAGAPINLWRDADAHRWGPYEGGCREADWINNCGVEDTHVDEGAFPWDDATDSQPGIVSGYIAIDWTGDDYVWSYDETAPPVDQPVHRDQLAFPEPELAVGDRQ